MEIEFQHVDHRADVLVSADRIFRAVLRSSRAVGISLPAAIARAGLVVKQQTGVDILAEISFTEVPRRECCDDYGVSRFCRAWLSGSLGLPANVCRSADLYSAYVRWRGELEVMPINRFSNHVTTSHQEIKKGWVTVNIDGKSVRVRCFVVMPDPFRDVAMGMRTSSATLMIEEFSFVLSSWGPE